MSCHLRFTVFEMRVWCGLTPRSKTVNRNFHKLLARGAILLLAFFFFASSVVAEQRFPPPEFESGHQLPVTTTPAARSLFFQYQDVLALAACLAVASWLIYKARSRKGLVALSIFSVLYFGFYRKGCVCGIGSLQNVSLALGDRGYAVPLGVVAFLVQPQVF
jgi:NosR/NirI family transcriptional regulator, nitrous oxide reductase regulator